MSCGEGPDVIPSQKLATSLSNQVDFIFRMVVPAGEGVWIVVLVPSKALIGFRKDDLKIGWSVLEQSSAVIRHLVPLFYSYAVDRMRQPYAEFVRDC